MTILPDTEDRFHNVTAPGAYEWSYFDGLSEDGEWGFVAIWFRGIPMSPNYTAAIDRHFSRPTGTPPDPADYSAFNFNIYHRGRRIYYALHERPRELWAGSASTPDLRLAGNTVHAGVGPGRERIYLLAVDTELPWQRSRVVGDIRIDAPWSDLSAISTRYDPDAQGHFWVPAALDGRFTAQLDLWRRGRGVDKLRFSGRAYHDRNFGTRPLHHIPGAWEWGRVHSKRDLFVYFMLAAEPDRESPFRRLILLRDGALLASESEVEPESFPGHRHWTGLAWPEATAAEGRRLAFRATPRGALDSGPFYHRHLSDFHVTLDGEQVIDAPGIGEYLLPARLGIGFFRPFVRFRVRRS
jgi:carotenoid 1,2-hydratase